MAEVKTISVGGFALPVSEDAMKEMGEAVHNISLAPIVFSFEYCRIKFRCTCNESAQGQPKLTLYGRLGGVPFTAESTIGRLAALTVVKAANRDLNGMIGLEDGTIILNHQIAIPSPVTATSLISAIVTTLARATPYISLLFEIIGAPKSKSTLPPLSHP